jgi:hypothetical protein
MITGSGLAGSSVAQNPGMGQKEYPDRNILGLRQVVGKRGKDHMQSALPVR